MFKVPIDKLYTVMASCLYNEANYFCPVLVKVNDPKILQQTHQKEFLLQVWTREGKMIFERALDVPIMNWNISGNKFVFQETRQSRAIFIVKLFKDRTPMLFKFNLPEQAV